MEDQLSRGSIERKADDVDAAMQKVLKVGEKTEEKKVEKPKKKYNYTKKTGRPTKYKEKLGKEICKRIAEGESVRSICKSEDMPDASTIYLWLIDEDKKEFFKQYAIAKDAQAELMFDELLEIADDGTNDWIERENKDGSIYEVVNNEVVQRSRLRVDTRKWYLSKVLPKKYGDKLELDGKTEVAFTGFEKLEEKQLDAVIKQLQGRIGESSPRESEQNS